jgi:hypothetical protein
MCSCIAHGNWCCDCLVMWGASNPPFISKGGEVIRKVTQSVTT